MTIKTRRRVQTALILLAAACIAFGAARGEVRLILTKAILICLECIGLG
ncbi:MAG: hypothetical protein FWF47_05770 [Clostridia bacterium]|nr:hypothetical protein [Clostridia bacterium]